jgi:hypothetical protein
MSQTNKSIRIRTTPNGTDKYVTVKLEHEFDFLEILSLKISQEDLYRSFCADYGVVVGRVVANKGFGLPNAKVSVFIPITSEDEKNDLIRDLYPFKSPTDKDKNFVRYNLLLSKETCSLNQAVGTFPTKEEVLNNDIVLEIYDKYYKYTTKTNSAGDYMIFGVPTGQRTIHMDVDLSDVSIASVRPYDLIAEGAPENFFESKTRFKVSTDLDTLPQIKSGNKGVDVIPFWGDSESCEIGITRVDFDTQAQIKPTALFLGSIFSDTGKNSLNKRCNPRNDMGEQDELRTGAGRIEMIRASKINQVEWVQNGELVPTELEEFTINGGDLIDEDGTFVTPIPMNVGHVITDEFGNLVPSLDPEVGIATKGFYRMKINFNEPPANIKRRTAHMLFPSLSRYHGGTAGYTSTGNVNDIGGTEDQRFTDNINDYKDIDKDFHLFEWKQIYTISHFIKKYKKGSGRWSFLGLKNTDVSGETNLIPFNTAVYKYNILYAISEIIIDIVAFFLRLVVILTSIQLNIAIGGYLAIFGATIWNFCNWFGIRPFGWITNLFGKLKDKDPTCPAYQGANAPDDRGFVLTCGDSVYCVNLSNPCPDADVDCGNLCNDVVDSGSNGENNDNGIVCSGDDCDCGSSFLYLKFEFFVASEEECDAIQAIKQWQCCTIYELAQYFNVIRKSFFDAWLTGSAYMFQFKYKSKLKNDGTRKDKFCGPGADTSGGNNYHKNECCAHDYRYSSSDCSNEDKCCNKCVLRGPDTTKERNWTNIENYHYTWHNDSVNGSCGGYACGNGATDIGDLIYCNAYSSTKIVSLGRMEMCPDTLNDIEKCIAAQECTIDIYKQNPGFFTGTFYEEGWDPNFWTQGIGPTSYQDPREIILFFLYLSDCNVGQLFTNGNITCHEKELEDGSGKEYYRLFKEVSKIHTEVALTEDASGNPTFDPSVGINPVTGENTAGNVDPTDPTSLLPGSGFIFDVAFGQRFNPCVNNNDCLPPPAPWTPTSIYLNTLVTDAQPIDSPGVSSSGYNANKNIPYFYFGIKPGRTAIEKLRKDYFVNG